MGHCPLTSGSQLLCFLGLLPRTYLDTEPTCLVYMRILIENLRHDVRNFLLHTESVQARAILYLPLSPISEASVHTLRKKGISFVEKSWLKFLFSLDHGAV